MMEIYVDHYREEKLATCLKKNLVDVDIKNFKIKINDEITLQDGDIQIFLYNQLILIIERKRIRDLSGSCCDGRLQNCFNLEILAQKKQIILQDDFIFQPMIVLIVEGKFQKASRRCFSKDILENYLDRYRFKIPSLKILYTQDTLGTADRILHLAKQIPQEVKNQIKLLSLPCIHINLKEEEKKVSKVTNKFGNQMKFHFKFLRKLPKVSIFLANTLLDFNLTAFDLLIGGIPIGKQVELSQVGYPRSQVKIGIFKWQEISKEVENNKIKLMQEILLCIPYMKRYQDKTHILQLLSKSLLLTHTSFDTWKLYLEQENIKEYKLSISVLQRIWDFYTFHPKKV